MKTSYLYATGMLVSGTLITISFALQNRQVIDGQRFFHPFFQSLLFFMAEMSSLAFLKPKKDVSTEDSSHIILNKDSRSQRFREITNKVLPSYGLFPAVLDGMTMTLQNIGLALISPSVYQILRGGVIIATAFFSVTILKKRLNALHLIGLIVVVLGIATIGISNLLFADEDVSKGSNDGESQGISSIPTVAQAMTGYGLVLFSLSSHGLLLIKEEKILAGQYRGLVVSPAELVAAEGAWGTLLYSVFLVVLHFIPCSGEFCSVPKGETTGTLESITIFFEQVSSSGVLALLLLITFPLIVIYTKCALTVTQEMSAVSRSLVDVMRCVFLWVIGISLTLSGNGHWENTSAICIIFQIVGFILIIIGSLIFNQILLAENKQVKQLQEVGLLLLSSSSSDSPEKDRIGPRRSPQITGFQPLPSLSHNASGESYFKDNLEL